MLGMPWLSPHEPGGVIYPFVLTTGFHSRRIVTFQRPIRWDEEHVSCGMLAVRSPDWINRRLGRMLAICVTWGGK